MMRRSNHGVVNFFGVGLGRAAENEMTVESGGEFGRIGRAELVSERS